MKLCGQIDGIFRQFLCGVLVVWIILYNFCIFFVNFRQFLETVSKFIKFKKLFSTTFGSFRAVPVSRASIKVQDFDNAQVL